VIFDSCHSGSGTRTEEYIPSLHVRGIELPEDYKVLSTVYEELLATVPDDQREAVISKKFERVGPASHVLLAACSSQGTAKELNGRGNFTSALMRLIRSSDINTMTYRQIIAGLDDLDE
jgi:hypothetical protein